MTAEAAFEAAAVQDAETRDATQGAAVGTEATEATAEAAERAAVATKAAAAVPDNRDASATTQETRGKTSAHVRPSRQSLTP